MFVTAEQIYAEMAMLRKREETKQKETEQNDAALFFAAERSIEVVKAYCGIEKIPEKLKGVCIGIGLLLYDNENYDGERCFLKSMKQGNVSMSYETEWNKWNLKKCLEDFSEELNRFRVIKW